MMCWFWLALSFNKLHLEMWSDLQIYAVQSEDLCNANKKNLLGSIKDSVRGMALKFDVSP